MSWCKHDYFEKHSNMRVLLLGIAAILIWRGVWGLADVYLFPNDQDLSFVVSIIIGLALALFINGRKISEFA
jgi:hypothetical protein